MSNHHFHRSSGPFTILLFYYFISIRFQAEVFASRVAKPECRTTIFTGPPDRLLFYYCTISFPFGSRQRFFPFRVAKPERQTTIFTGWLGSPRFFFASRTTNPACRLTFLHVGQTYPNHFELEEVVSEASLRSHIGNSCCNPALTAVILLQVYLRSYVKSILKAARPKIVYGTLPLSRVHLLQGSRRYQMSATRTAIPTPVLLSACKLKLPVLSAQISIWQHTHNTGVLIVCACLVGRNSRKIAAAKRKVWS